ncbi:HlyD family secretion protein [Melioribacter sp. OK-6-Me]|uniref:HlyD family secretion protein n=1 Tax=unclassified Melioribacter TaxID=2627329 RepID=UPI003EDAE3E8
MNKKIIIPSIVLGILILLLLIVFSEIFSNDENIITGLVESHQVDVSSKIPGRLKKIYVREGDKVNIGDTLAIIESKELEAKLNQAKGALEAANAKYRMALNGVRSEEKEAALNLYLQAKSQYEYASKTYNRFKELYKDNVISLQEFDEIEFKYNAAKAQMEAAKAKYEMALNGARDEEIAATRGLLTQAENAYNEVLAYSNELVIKAPVLGEITDIYAENGELINSGYPVFSILPENDRYVILHVREDEMTKIAKGKIFKTNVPALNLNEFPMRVNYISPLGDFADWKPTNRKGDFDLKTFEVHLVPTDNNNKLLPGMTVQINFE